MPNYAGSNPVKISKFRKGDDAFDWRLFHLKLKRANEERWARFKSFVWPVLKKREVK